MSGVETHVKRIAKAKMPLQQLEQLSAQRHQRLSLNASGRVEHAWDQWEGCFFWVWAQQVLKSISKFFTEVDMSMLMLTHVVRFSNDLFELYQCKLTSSALLQDSLSAQAPF